MFIADEVELDPAAVEKFLKDPKARENLRTLASRLDGLTEFSLQSTESVEGGDSDRG